LLAAPGLPGDQLIFKSPCGGDAAQVTFGFL
jgi:hypothetical protein